MVQSLLDTNLITLVESSVLVNGVTKEDIFEDSIGVLSINLGTIGVGVSFAITFHVQQKEYWLVKLRKHSMTYAGNTFVYCSL